MVYALAIVAGVVAYVVGSLLRQWVDGRARRHDFFGDRFLHKKRGER